MNAYAFSKALLLIPFVAFIYVAGVWFSVRAMYLEISREAAFRAKIGSGWRAEYEKQYGSIAEYRIKIV
ncbi:MAG TPA: hypothetical protein VK731_02845, partial [Candidatus Cybelea sp.]|nr:hypothetical protein [Candidatus Cybelea sp.]